MPPFPTDMKKLLSLPPNVVDCFHTVSDLPTAEYFCTSDPVDCKLGSGGGTTWLLAEAALAEGAEDFDQWLSREKRILLHAGGQSRRLPAYAACGKVLLPVPVFRWARGQRLDQTLLSLQLPLYERIMAAAPDSLRTLVASGDVYIRATEPLLPIPEVDVVCYGLWADPASARNHGVFFMHRDHPERLDFMLQKPSIEQQHELASTHLSLMDLGIWLLSDRAVSLLRRRSFGKGGDRVAYDLYSQFGCALGANPTADDEELRGLTVAVLPLTGGEFYHFGTTPEMISSTAALQNVVKDQRLILRRGVKKHSTIFTQNARVEQKFAPELQNIWVENSHLPADWQLEGDHVLTGIPVNDRAVHLQRGQCVDVEAFGDSQFVLRPYGFHDAFRGDVHDAATHYLGRPVGEWLSARGITADELGRTDDLQAAALFPVCDTTDELFDLLEWMLAEQPDPAMTALWRSKQRLSADEIAARANLVRQEQQRRAFRRDNLPLLAEHYQRSVMYQIDLRDAAQKFVNAHLDLPPALTDEAPLMHQIRDAMFRAQVHRLRSEDGDSDETRAFSLLRDGLTQSARGDLQLPRLDVYRDQIVWGRSAVRIDVAGGWTDTPPYCLNSGGNVVNLAIELNGQQPLQVYVKSTQEPQIVCRSIDLGAMEVITTYEELAQFNKVGSPFSIPKAALALCGFLPQFAAEPHRTLRDCLNAFGGGIEITLLAAIPAGSGLGTSSILAATVLGALSDFCGLGWDKFTVGNRTLILEQLLTTGGGWQDQFGGVLHGVKLLQTKAGFDQTPVARWLPDTLFMAPEQRACHLLYYTGITRTAKNILAEIVRGMFLNCGTRLRLLDEMKEHAMDMFEVLQQSDLEHYGRLVRKTWQQNKLLDAGTGPEIVAQLCRRIDDLCWGYKLPGAGGGGYLYMVAKDPEAAARIRTLLLENPLTESARFVDMKLSHKGLQVSRS